MSLPTTSNVNINVTINIYTKKPLPDSLKPSHISLDLPLLSKNYKSSSTNIPDAITDVVYDIITNNLNQPIKSDKSDESDKFDKSDKSNKLIISDKSKQYYPVESLDSHINHISKL